MSTHKRKELLLPKEVLTAAWAIALGAIAPMLDSTMVNIAIGKLTKDFNTTLDTIQWSVTGYVLALAIAVPVSGWLMNKYNGKKIFIGSVIAFGVISVFAGMSRDVSSFIVFRLLQGFSAGIMTPLMSTLLVKTAGSGKPGKSDGNRQHPYDLRPILATCHRRLHRPRRFMALDFLHQRVHRFDCRTAYDENHSRL